MGKDAVNILGVGLQEDGTENIIGPPPFSWGQRGFWLPFRLLIKAFIGRVSQEEAEVDCLEFSHSLEHSDIHMPIDGPLMLLTQQVVSHSHGGSI